MDTMRASRQWSSRPADERYWLEEFQPACQAVYDASNEVERELGQLRAVPNGDDIHIVGPHGNPATPTNWGFAQLCRQIGAPAEYLTGLPAQLACDCLNNGLKGNETVKLLLQRNGHVQLRSVTSPGYTRWWDTELCKILKPILDAGWKVPPARPAGEDSRSRPATEADLIPGMTGGAQVQAGDLIAPSGVYRGDRDSFVFLVNPNRPDDDGLFKGIIGSNSEVGKASIRFTGFSHEGVCGNHIIWGASDVCEIRKVHRGDLTPFIGDLRTWLKRYTDTDVGIAAQIAQAKTQVLGKDREEVCERVHKFGLAILTKRAIAAAYSYAEQWEHTAGATPNTIWGYVHGLTRYSQTAAFADQRHALDLAAGKILATAS